MDFELGLRGAAKAVFKQVEIGGCPYHLAALFKKRLQSVKMLEQYQQDPEIAQSARMILAMAFLPPEKLEKAYAFLERTLPERLQPVLTWFGDNYLGTLTMTHDNIEVSRKHKHKKMPWQMLIFAYFV